MAPSQSCVRCRSRRMKCDLRLPKCTSCLHAGVECCTEDPSLVENVPRSYIASLQQQVERLECQIRSHLERNQAPHPNFPEKYEVSTQIYDYIGPGTSMALFDQLCQLPLLFPQGSSTANLSEAQFSLEVTTNAPPKSFVLPIPGLEFDTFFPAEVQRRLLDYFFNKISLEFPPVLSKQQGQMFSQEDNPLLACHISPNPWLRIILISVFAIAARVMSRDLNAEYSYLEHVCLNDIKKALSNSRIHFSIYDEHSLDQVRVLCLSALHELVGPGRSKLSMDVLNATQLLLGIVPYIAKTDQNGLESASQLAFFLSQIELSICIHFKRQSAQYAWLRELSNQPATWLDTSMEVLQLFLCDDDTSVTEAALHSIISKHHQVHDPADDQLPLEESTLLLYMSLHPIFSKNLSWLTSTGTMSCPCSTDLLIKVAEASRTYIENIATKLASRQTILCIWLTLERVIQAGFVWVIYIVYRIRYFATNSTHGVCLTSGSDFLEPLARCDYIFSSLTEKWTPGIPYRTIWNTIRKRAFDAVINNGSVI